MQLIKSNVFLQLLIPRSNGLFIDVCLKRIKMHLENNELFYHGNNKYFFSLIPKIFASSLFLTGIFALVGSLYTWGGGFILSVPPETDLSLYFSDLIITAPLSLISAYGFWNLRRWGLYLSWFVSGVYIYGSAIVYIMILQQGYPYPMDLLIPPIFGIIIAITIMYWSWKNQDQFR